MTPDQERALLATLRRIERNTLDIEARQLEIQMNQAEQAAAIEAVATSLTATSDELNKALAEIIAATSNAGQTTPEQDAAMAKLQTVAAALAGVAKTLDDLNPDA